MMKKTLEVGGNRKRGGMSSFSMLQTLVMMILIGSTGVYAHTSSLPNAVVTMNAVVEQPETDVTILGRTYICTESQTPNYLPALLGTVLMNDFEATAENQSNLVPKKNEMVMILTRTEAPEVAIVPIGDMTGSHDKVPYLSQITVNTSGGCEIVVNFNNNVVTKEEMSPPA